MRCRVEGIDELLLLDLGDLQVQRVDLFWFRGTCESTKGAPVVADDEDRVSASESGFERRLIVKVCCDYLDAAFCKYFGLVAVGVASQSANLPLRLFEVGVDD